jgi:serine/threonine protein phosphatase PrpC
LGAWAVFDGHGGSAAATYASNALLKMAAEALDAPAAGRAVAAADLPPVKGLPAGDAAAWRAGAELARRAPAALAAAFLRADREARRRFGEGGTTATLALLVGWDLVVANVGDSLAFLDTGAEVLQVCGNHRIDDSAAERARLEAGGAAVHPSTIDGAFAGPLRVWPGGLAMSRTIGDADAGDACAAEPAVCRVALPPAGARLILASDGLWDAVQPKTAAHHVRGLAAHEAAHRLLALAIKKDRLKDDVTVLVVDFLPDGPAEAAPPALAAGRPAAAAGARAAARVWHPLEQEVADALAVGAERRRQVLAAAGEAAADAAAVAARAAEARAEREAAAAAEAARAKAGGGTLYAELQEQRFLSPEELDAAREAAEPEPPAVDAAASPGWEAVGNAGAAAAPPRGRGGKGKGRGKERGAAAEAPASPPPAPPPQAATGARPPRGRRPREQGAAPLPPPPAAPQLPPPRVLVVPKAAPAAGTAAGAPAARQASAGAPASAPARSGDGSGAGSAQGDAPGKKRSRAGAKNRRGPGAGAPTTGAP